MIYAARYEILGCTARNGAEQRTCKRSRKTDANDPLRKSCASARVIFGLALATQADGLRMQKVQHPGFG